MSKTIEEIKKMRDEAEEKIGKILTELAECGLHVGNVRTVQLYVDEDGRFLVDTTKKARPMVAAHIALHLQEKPA